MDEPVLAESKMATQQQNYSYTSGWIYYHESLKIASLTVS